jgi:tetratricopeptide (TPR) repeat protein/DNA-binding transcriptional ArsR family regulator
MALFNYPPREIYDISRQKKPDYDHIILWLLNNNEFCNWSHFVEEPIDIPVGTLSRHLKKLKDKGFIDKVSRGTYKITIKGRNRFYELSKIAKKHRKLSFPPKIIKEGRDYSHWILWMLYNNTFCRRKDFRREPLLINNSSLTKNLNSLIQNGSINDEDGKLKITSKGKSQYALILQNYKLDRQAILEEERKNIEEINKEVLNFFKKFKIRDEETQFRFITYTLKLSFENVNQLLKSEEHFHKILLYLALNHPERYPNFISSQDFSKIYQIKKSVLDYYVDEISAGKIYPTKFFKLKGPSGGLYYFQTGGKLERMLQIITEEQINKMAYINTIFSKTLHTLPISIRNSIINQVFGLLKETLLHEDFKESLKEFLPEYIKYLSYQITEKPEIKTSFEKLEGIIWQDMSSIFEAQFSEDFKKPYKETIEEIDNKIKLNPDNIQLYELKMKILIYYNQYKEVLELLDQIIKRFPSKEIDIQMKKASIYKKKKDIKRGLEIIEELILKYPENANLLNYKAYWLHYLGKKEESLKLLQRLIEVEPNNGIYYDNYGEILMYFEEYEEATKKFLKALVLCKDEWFIYQTYIKLGICYKALAEVDLAIKNLKKGKQLIENSSNIEDIKNNWLLIAGLFLSEIEQQSFMV